PALLCAVPCHHLSFTATAFLDEHGHYRYLRAVVVQVNQGRNGDTANIFSTMLRDQLQDVGIWLPFSQLSVPGGPQCTGGAPAGEGRRVQDQYSAPLRPVPRARRLAQAPPRPSRGFSLMLHTETP
ncbi:hypothetical protein DPEC_G00266070, partial [Dallia pectoralis]